ncbi:NEP1-interacting protein 2-like [Olea europaea var. sylvestris]|uniref:NEP1-interacting protein 2-like n=1 Tax=Olea europaea var. sylvestris TaxID=158386 RepID=UPI000C1D3409|nr:NEP1-interacting protein 2-like [Olea europaea var. sylvestris]
MWFGETVNTFQVALICSLVNGKIFMEWVSPAVLKAYQWQDFKNRESAKMLPSCRHFFHVHCIDEWLLRQGTCPMCRREI